MTKTFTQAVDYVNNNQDTWNRMINQCYVEWAYEFAKDDNRSFSDYVLEEYGILVDPRSYNDQNYFIIDNKKYLLFTIKFAV